MGIYVFVVQMRWIAVVRIRICRIMRIYRIVTMLCIVGCVASSLPPLWIADQVRNDGRPGCLVLSCSPVSPCHPVDTALKPV